MKLDSYTIFLLMVLMSIPLIILKLKGIIDWNWISVISPLWFGIFIGSLSNGVFDEFF